MFYSKSCLTKAINISIPFGQILLYVPFGTSWTIKLKSTIEFVNVELYFQRSINADWFDSVCVHLTCQSKYNREKLQSIIKFSCLRFVVNVTLTSAIWPNIHVLLYACILRGKTQLKVITNQRNKKYIKPCKNILKKSETVLKNCL